MEPFATFDEDTVFVQNIRVRIVKSTSDSFQVVMVKMANGRSKNDADDIAGKINYNINQKDSVLMLDKGIALTQTEKFRNQQVILTIAVPVGKRIKVNEKIGWNNYTHMSVGWDDEDWGWNYYSDQNEEKWRSNVEYIQTEKGLERIDRQKDDEDNDNSNKTLDEFKKSKEQILREKEQKLKELKEIDKQLDTPADSSKYHYQPEAPKKSDNKKTVQSANVNLRNTELPVISRDLLMMRFSI